MKEKEKQLVQMYRDRLLTWFRYVLLLPFKPKPNQLYHLFICSNYETGIVRTKTDYARQTGNTPYLPDKELAIRNFYHEHSLAEDSIQFWVLWRLIKYHENGVCDVKCRDFANYDEYLINDALQWLFQNNYLVILDVKNPQWSQVWPRYRLNWMTVETKLKIRQPKPLEPLSEQSSLFDYFKSNTEGSG
jgi:hypothetical protein